MKHCSEWFEKKYKCTPLENKKAKYKLKENCEKCKKVLSANLESAVNIDCLMEDEDLHINFKRDKFEELSADVFEKFRELFSRFKKTLANSSVTYKQIELVGGSARIPKIQEILMEVFETQELKKTLNFDECIAQGASIQAAVVSPFYSVQSTKLKDHFAYNIKLSDDSGKSFNVVETGSHYPAKKSITLMRNEDFTLEARYNIENSKFPVRDDFLYQYHVKVKYADVEREKSRKLKVFFEVDNFGLFSVKEILAYQE